MSRRASTPPLIGRQAELARLVGLLDEAAAGRPAVGLLGGDAGIGKTRTLGELCAVAEERGFLVLTGQCVELGGGGGLPYLPFVDALRAASVDPLSAETMSKAVGERPALARLLALGTIGADAGEDSGQLPLFSGVLSVLSQLSAQVPVLLVLEDVHWADRSSRDLLAFLSRTLRQEQVAIVASYRSDDLHRRHALRPVLTELARVPGVERIDLPPLPDRDMIRLVADLSDAPIPEPRLAELLVRAEGNAFFAEELLAASADAASEVPGELADVLLGRVEQLSPTAQHVVRVASVAGRSVNHALLAAAAGVDAPALDEALRDAVGRQLLYADSTGGYTFRHALLQEAIYSDLLPGERTRLHSVYVDLLGRPGQPWGCGSASDLAYHSLAGHDLGAALKALDRAAAEAMSLGAPFEALRHLEQALSLWERVPDAESLVGQPRWRLGLRAAAAASASGEPARAVALAEESLTQVDKIADPLRYAEISVPLNYYLMTTDAVDRAIEVASAALPLVPSQPPTPLRAAVTAGYARTMLNLGHYAEAGRVAEEALECARASDSLAEWADALTTLAMLAEKSGDGDLTEELLDKARQVAGRSGDAVVQLRILHNLAIIPLDHGDLRLALERSVTGMEFAERHGLSLSGWGLQLRHYRHVCLFALGQWDEVEQLSSFMPRVGGVVSGFVMTFACTLLVARGDARTARQLARVQPFWVEDVLLAHLAGCLAVQQATWDGQPDRARELNRTAMDLVSNAWGHDSIALVRHAALGLAAEADRAVLARAIGDHATAADSVEVGEGLFETATHAMLSGKARTGTPGVEAKAWFARATAERARLAGDNDVELWRAAVAGFDFGDDSDVYETARGRWRLAEALMEAGNRDEAVEQWTLAVAAAERLAAAPLLRALEDLRRRARLVAAVKDGAPAKAAAAPSTALTPRELEVLRLVAEGRTNRQIGAALFISDKTASVHVSNLMAKLGVASRTEAASFAYREGLLLPPA
ncbi:helix-turn-helix transcriptional regulator [Acidothermaceae bacterium B102]|nr:helix-turn-helix transcriptional regulator [Acidothermaceae bacterium B102]